jgi:ABC-type polysaccharide/polyol phosphate export permease
VRIATFANELIREQIEYRELLVRITARDLLLRYKQTAMGFGWAVFMPLLNTLIFSIIFTRVAPLDTEVPYPLFAYCGLVTWNWFASSLRFAVTSLTSNANLVTKVYFPREILPFSAVLVAFVDFAVAGTVLVALMAWYGIWPGASVLVLPVILLAQLAFTAGMALLLAMANLFYRDVKYLFEVAITIWMFATSVVYPIERVGGQLGALLMINPMTHVIDAYRAVLLHGVVPPATTLAPLLGVCLATFAVAWTAFHVAEFRFAENI